jgi:hypothetical protein
VIKSRLTRWAENVACLGNERTAYIFLVGKAEEKRLSENPHVDRRIILKRILKK